VYLCGLLSGAINNEVDL